jgi:hypothetical protein
MACGAVAWGCWAKEFETTKPNAKTLVNNLIRISPPIRGNMFNEKNLAHYKESMGLLFLIKTIQSHESWQNPINR